MRSGGSNIKFSGLAAGMIGWQLPSSIQQLNNVPAFKLAPPLNLSATAHQMFSASSEAILLTFL